MKSWRTACQQGGVRELRPHDLRHTCASRLATSGVNIQTVQELMGHKDIRMTRRYSHLANAHLAEAAERLGAWKPKPELPVDAEKKG